jgi:hypothetical protein
MLQPERPRQGVGVIVVGAASKQSWRGLARVVRAIAASGIE